MFLHSNFSSMFENTTLSSGSEEQAAILSLISSGNHLRIEDGFFLVAVTILFYDFILTFGDEVELVWKTTYSPINILFIANRYFAIMACTICIVALFSPNWSLSRCQHFAKFEGVFTEVVVLISEIMLIMRVYAVHKKNNLVLLLLSSIWTAQLCLMSFTLRNSGPVIIPRTSVTFGCVLVPNPNIGDLDLFFIVPSVVFDGVTIILLLWGLYSRTENKNTSSLFRVLLRDGVLYFAVVVFVNTAWISTGLTLATDLKNILAVPSTVMTNVLISRLTLNLKSQSGRSRQEADTWSYPLLPRLQRSNF